MTTNSYTFSDNRHTQGKAVLAMIAATIFAVFTPAFAQQKETSTKDQSWVLQERTLPLPAAASDELRASVANAPQPDVTAFTQGTAFKTREEWVNFIRMADQGGMATVEALTERFKVTIEKNEIAGVNVYSVTPANLDPANKNRLFVNVHGGAYVVYGRRAGLDEAILVAHRANIPVLSIDYRMPPDHPFPAAVEDVVAVWKNLLEKRDAKSMALGGTSAGGGLALASIHKFIDLGIPVPGALFAGTPWSDLTKTGDSYSTNEGVDSILTSYDGLLAGAAELYAGDYALTDPLVSPVYGDFNDFPPTYLVTGTRDLFLSNTVRVFRKLRTAGVAADLNVFESMSHAGYLKVIDSPESEQTFEELGTFLSKHLEE